MDLFTATSSVKNTIEYTTNDFISFLLSNRVLQIGMAFAISTQVNKLVSDFIDNIISPIIKRFVDKERETTLKQKKVTIFGIEFEIGNFIMSILKFFIIMIVFYAIFKLFNKYGTTKTT